jgi:uncharacterized caspase-like protein
MHIKRFVGLALVGCLFLTYSSIAQAPLDVRVALVIGNAAYVNIPALGNSTNDAKSMATILRKLGFQVVEVVDGSKAQMDKAVENLQDLLKGKQAVAMLYYAGHGLQLDWHNYMVPVDVKLTQASDVPKQTIDIETVITSFKKATTRMNIIVLDACRDNPFAGKASSGKGLAQLDAPVGTFLAFATAPGNVAEDGDVESGNGLFTQYLLKELQKPARIEDVFKRVRLQVRQKSQGRQIPWDSSSLEDDFSFNDGNKHTFNPEDLVREAKAREDKLRAALEAAKQEELRIAKQEELEKQRLAEAQRKRELEAQAQKQRDLEIAKQRELESQKLAEAQKIKDLQARQKAEAESKERERLLALAAEEEKKKTQEAERQRLKAEADAKEREKQLALAAEQEKQKALAAQQAIAKAKAEEAQRLKEIELAKLQVAEEAKRNKGSSEEAKEKQFAIEKADWDKIKDSKNADDFYAYLNKYPSGVIAQKATFALEQLDKAKITSQADKNGLVQELGEPRYRLGDKFTRVTRDDYTGREIKRWDFNIDRIDNGLVYFKSADEEIIGTLDGSAVQTVNPRGTFKFDPPVLYLPGDEFKIGKSWTVSTYQTTPQGKFTRTVNIKIVAYEKLTIQAGTYWAYKFESNGWVGNTRYEETYWNIPDWGIRLKSITKFYPSRGAATLETTELVSFSRGNKVTTLPDEGRVRVSSR